MSDPHSTDQHSPDQNPYRLTPAQLRWHDGDVPEASAFGDIYYQKADGLTESRYVFLQHNQLPERFASLTEPVFTIAETGFGTGLNFLASWALWQQTAPANARLHFISAEKFPLTHADLSRALLAWPELKPFADQLLASYPLLIPGQHCLVFADGRVTLHLLFGDASTLFEQVRESDHPAFSAQRPRVDAWFLDGFAPAKNADLWQPALFELMSQLSRPGATVATFTAVGEVRRSLMKCGFVMQKVKGFGAKRDMLCGYYAPRAADDCPAQQSNPVGDNASTLASPTPPSADTPWYISTATQPSNRHAVVIGAGLAGCTTAYALASRGWQVTLLERTAAVAQGASGNPHGMLYTRLSPQAGLLNQFTLSSYLFALRYYQRLRQQQCLGEQDYADCGLLQLAISAKEQHLLRQLATTFHHLPALVQIVDASTASRLAGIPLAHGGYWLPGAGWLNPGALCRALSRHANIELKTATEVLTLDYDGRWQIGGRDSLIGESDTVIVANSNDARQLIPTQTLPLKPIRGQITLLDAATLSASPQLVLCHEGYITPAINGQCSLGATFDINQTSTAVSAEDHQRNLESLFSAIPALQRDVIDINDLEGRAALRCTSPDYLPLIGAVPEPAGFVRQYQALAKNARRVIDLPGCYYPGLFVNVGHGSRGLTSTPLCAELLAAQINDELPPLNRQLTKALNPARFIMRDIIRQRLQSN